MPATRRTAFAHTAAGFVQDLYGPTGHSYTHERYLNASRIWGDPTFASNAACQAVHGSADDAWMCLTPQYVYPYIQTPVFVLAAGYDEGLAGGDIGVKCKPAFSPSCTPVDKAYWEYYRANTSAHLQAAFDSTRDGLFLDACCPHCQSLTNGHANTWTGVTIGGVSPADGFDAWLTGGAAAAGAKSRDAQPYPSNPSCVGMGGARDVGVVPVEMY